MRHPSHKVLSEPQSLLLPEIPSSTTELPGIQEVKKNVEKGEPAMAENMLIYYEFTH